MDPKLKYILLKTVQDDGILPITSVCNMACQFCSHRNNPPGLDVHRLGHLDLELIEELLQYLDPEGPVIIGESATRIIEGDPLAHPEFFQIIELVRESFPRKEIRITTNGSFLDRERVDFLAGRRPVELNISLNCSSPAERVFLMADRRPEQVFTALELLAERELVFHGSIVAMPHLMGWESLGRTIELLNGYGAKSIRIFLPGFTRYSSARMQFPVEEMYGMIAEFIEGYKGLDTPVLLEPPVINDLQAVVKGIIPGSPAARSNLKKGALITAVNGERPLSRVDAFQRILVSANPLLQYEQEGVGGEPVRGELVLEKEAGERSGLILDYDLDPAVMDQLTRAFLQNRDKRIALLTSVAAEGIMGAFLDYYRHSLKHLYNPLQQDSVQGNCVRQSRLSPDRQSACRIEGAGQRGGTGQAEGPLEAAGREGCIDLLVAENRFFGGSIIAAGLLTVSDIMDRLRESSQSYDLLLLPGIIFDNFGNDLSGRNYREIEEEAGVTVEII